MISKRNLKEYFDYISFWPNALILDLKPHTGQDETIHENKFYLGFQSITFQVNQYIQLQIALT